MLTYNIEYIKMGDEIKGGEVIEVSKLPRPEGHIFWLHTFDTGEVVMSKGHPFFDTLIALDETYNTSEYTCDILTDTGYYYVDGVKLGSTLGGENA